MGSSASQGSIVIPTTGSGTPAPAVVQNNGFVGLGPLAGKFYLVKEVDLSFRNVRADTLIKASSETSVVLSLTAAPGTKVTRTYTSVVFLAATITGLVRLRLRVVEAQAGFNGSYRINLIVKKNGTAVATLTGPTRVNSSATFDWLLALVIPTTTFAAGDTFEVTWEHEIVTSAGFGTATIRTDPSVAGNEAIVEVDA